MVDQSWKNVIRLPATSSLAIERVLATSIRINSPLGVRRYTAHDEFVQGLRCAYLRQQRNDECYEESQTTHEHDNILLRQGVTRDLACDLGVVRHKPDDCECAADEQDHHRRQEDHVKGEVGRRHRGNPTVANLHVQRKNKLDVQNPHVSICRQFLIKLHS